MRIGDLNNTSFSEVWEGGQRSKVMQYLNPGIHCTFHCLRHESNLEVLDLIELTKEGKQIDLVDEFDRFI